MAREFSEFYTPTHAILLQPRKAIDYPLEWILENHDDHFPGSKGFFNGVISSVVMRYDTTSDDPLILVFMNHKPDPNHPIWRTH